MTRGQLPKAYLRIDPNIDQTHPDNLEGFVRLLCAANRQPTRGTFRSRAVLEALLGKAAVARLLARQDVTVGDDGSLTVPGWDVWQEGDFTVADRMRRYRDRHAGVTDTVTPDVTLPSPPSEARDSEASRQQGSKTLSAERETPAPPDDVHDDDPVVAFHVRTGRFPTPTFRGWIDDLGEAHGAARVAAMIDRTSMTGTNPKAYLERVRDLLRAEDHAAERAEAEAERARNAAKRAKPTPLRVAPVDQTPEEAEAELRAFRAEFGGVPA